MKQIKTIIFIIIILLNTIIISGCWDYTEIEDLSIIVGLAIDKSPTDNAYILTAELADINSDEKDSPVISKNISSEGATIVEAVKNLIPIAGQRIYWSHIKVLILSQDIAKEGIIPVMDWFVRDVETRTDIHPIISLEETAREIIVCPNPAEEITSFFLEDTIKTENIISNSPKIYLREFLNELSTEGVSAMFPTVKLVKNVKGCTPKIGGSAIFKQDKVVGFLNEEDTKNVLIVKDMAKEGILLRHTDPSLGSQKVTLEVINCKTKIKPILLDDQITMNINIKTHAKISEVQGTYNFLNESERALFKKNSEDKIEKKVQDVIEKVQEKYESDIFGFGNEVHISLPKVWKDIKENDGEDNWSRIFKSLNVNVNADITITGSSLMSKPIKIGD